MWAQRVNGPLRGTRWCVLISGRGSNLAAVLEKPDIEIALTVSSSSTANGLAKAARGGVPTLEFPKKNGKLDWDKLDQTLCERSIDAIFLLGFMRIVPESFVEKWRDRILNLHPSLLPKYPGLRSIERAMEAGDEVGVTVHHVVPEVDAGEALSQRRTFSANDTLRKTSGVNSANELFVHVDEQRIVKEIVDVWRR